MEAKIVSPRRSRHSVYDYQYILVSDAKTRKEAEALLGKSVEWKSPGKKPKTIKGKIARVHGNKGRVVALFEKGLPGQSVGGIVKLG